MGEEGQDGWGVLWLTLGPPDSGIELYWWCGGIGGLLVFYGSVTGALKARGSPQRVFCGMLMQAKVRVLGVLKYEVGDGGGVHEPGVLRRGYLACRSGCPWRSPLWVQT